MGYPETCVWLKSGSAGGGPAVGVSPLLSSPLLSSRLARQQIAVGLNLIARVERKVCLHPEPESTNKEALQRSEG